MRSQTRMYIQPEVSGEVKDCLYLMPKLQMDIKIYFSLTLVLKGCRNVFTCSLRPLG